MHDGIYMYINHSLLHVTKVVTFYATAYTIFGLVVTEQPQFDIVSGAVFFLKHSSFLITAVTQLLMKQAASVPGNDSYPNTTDFEVGRFRTNSIAYAVLQCTYTFMSKA